ncbi:TPA: HAD-IIB family hydrolase, partial [Enterococcus faecium]
MSNYRAITFFDLDGTLLDAKSKITPEVAKAMNALKENNVLPVIATGRTEAEIHSIMEDAGITSAVTMNGSFIRVDGEEIYSQTFSSEECQKMYDHVQLNGHELSYYNDQKIWCTGHSQTMINAYDFIHSDVPEIDPLGFKENTVNMLLIL